LLLLEKQKLLGENELLLLSEFKMLLLSFFLLTSFLVFFFPIIVRVLVDLFSIHPFCMLCISPHKQNKSKFQPRETNFINGILQNHLNLNYLNDHIAIEEALHYAIMHTSFTLKFLHSPPRVHYVLQFTVIIVNLAIISHTHTYFN